MNFNFNTKLNEFLTIILKNAFDFNVDLYIVGGAVRDKLLGYNIKDFDLIINGNAVEFSKTFPNSIKVISVHKEFSTVKVEYEGMKFDIASTRIEEYPYSGCLPVVKKIGVDIQDDVSRRDFTVNTLYCRLYLKYNQIKTELIDILNIQNDIHNKRLKVLHNKSYIDDPTRIIRGLGLKYRFEFDFSNKDLNLINNYLANIDRSHLSYDRCFTVLKEVLDFNPYLIFSEFLNNDYYKILTNQEIEYNLTKIKECVTLFKLNKTEQIVFFAEIIKNNPCTKFTLNTLLEFYKNFNKLDISKLSYYYYKTSDNNVLNYLAIKNIKPLINGNDLINLGYSQGKIFTEIFNSLLEDKFKNPDKYQTKEDELKYIRAIFPIK